MILDRYYQLAVFIAAILYFREYVVIAASVLIPLVLLGLPVLVGLLVWQELKGRVGEAGPRALVRLRWELSRGSRMFAGRRRKKIARALIKAYDLAPQAAMAEQASRLERLMQDACAIDLRVPPIFQTPLTAEGIGKFLAEAEGLSGPPRTALIAALKKAVPKDRPLGPLAQARAKIRMALRPLAGTTLERRRIGYVFLQVLTRGRASSNERLVSLVALIRDAREKFGLEGIGLNALDPLVDLPLGVQRELVLIARIAFGNADMGRIALTDPSRIKRLRAIKDRVDTVSAPHRQLWDPKSELTTEPENSAAPPHSGPEAEAQEPKQEATEQELRTTLESNVKEAILLARTWPISGDVPGRSWLGGTPLLPKSIPWPVQKGAAAPLHFLAQIDCAELPRVKGGEAMPQDGLLLFFAPISEEMLWDDEEETTQVLYVPAAVIPDIPAPLPARLADISGAPGHRSYPRWPIIPRATKSYFWDHGMPLKMHELAQSAQDAAMAPFLPPPSRAKRTPLFESSLSRNPETGEALKDERGNYKRQFNLAAHHLEAGFPYCGAAMTRFVANYNAQLWALIDRERSFKSYLERGLETSKDAERDREKIRNQDAKIARLSETLAELEKVSARLTSFGDFEKVPVAEARFFADWLEYMMVQAHPAIDKAMRSALKSLAQQAATDPEMQALLPQALFDLFDAELRPSPAQSEHMMLGHTQIRTNSTAGPGIRLLALDSDSGLDFMFCDVGMAEFWIDPEDLARRDFSRVIARTAGG